MDIFWFSAGFLTGAFAGALLIMVYIRYKMKKQLGMMQDQMGEIMDMTGELEDVMPEDEINDQEGVKKEEDSD